MEGLGSHVAQRPDGTDGRYRRGANRVGCREFPRRAEIFVQCEDCAVLDRVGGGDSFVAGLAYCMLSGMELSDAVEWGAAHGALALTTPGDTSTATLDEARSLVGGAGARVRR